jgi:hypothetical protein
MEIGNFYFVATYDTIREVQRIIPSRTQVQITLEPINTIPAERLRPLSESDILIMREPEKPPKKILYKNRKLENPNLLNDSTLALRPTPDHFLEQIAVPPGGLVLPVQSIHHSSSDWFTFMLLLSLVFFAFVRNSSRKYFSMLFQSITSFGASSRLFREQNTSLIQGAAVMELFYLLMLGLFGFQLVKFYGIGFQIADFHIFLICFGAVLAYFTVKLGLYRLLGHVGETQAEISEYLFNMRNHNKVLGILLMPLVGFTAWSRVAKPEYFLITGLVLIALIYLFYLFRGVQILLKKHYSIFYLFLYLCTLEFLPLFFLYKVIRSS